MSTDIELLNQTLSDLEVDDPGCARIVRARIAELENIRDNLILQAQVWAGEAKTQRATVEEVGEILGGIPDWGPIAKTVSDRLAVVDGLPKRVEDAYKEGYVQALGGPKFALVPRMGEDWIDSDARHYLPENQRCIKESRETKEEAADDSSTES